MDLLKAQLDRLSKQLGGLSASQKMLTAALVAIMAMTLVWWGKYAGDPEMEPVLDQSFSANDITRITASLDSRGIQHSVSGDRILVPTDRKYEVLALLSINHLMPRNTSSGFDEMLKNASNPFNPDSMNKTIFNHGKELALSQIIQHFPNVAEADVMIDPTREMHVTGSVDPSATIDITMQDGATADQNLVDAAADVVEGAQSGLDRSHIKVVVGGVPRRLHNTDDAGDGDGSESLDIQHKAEVTRANAIKDYLGYIPDLRVFVTVKVNSTSTQQHQTTYDPKTTVSKPIQTTNETTETVTPGNSGAAPDPGIGSNLIQTPGSGGGGLSAAGPPATSTQTKEMVTNGVFVPSAVIESKTPAGDVTIVAATVRVPMTYFESVYRHQNPDTKNPSNAQLKPLVTDELTKIKNDVMKCTNLTSANDVAVETYEDASPIATADAKPASAASMTNLVGSHGRDLVLGGLAVMSLFMVSMMVRKGTPVVAGAASASAAPVGAPAVTVAQAAGPLGSDEAIAGEVGANNILSGMELDDETVRSQQMVDQVSSMVKENPDVAASLVKRWMSRS